ncbi:hypothetical protein D3C81_1046310 [compost metagenome]
MGDDAARDGGQHPGDRRPVDQQEAADRRRHDGEDDGHGGPGLGCRAPELSQAIDGDGADDDGGEQAQQGAGNARDLADRLGQGGGGQKRDRAEGGQGVVPQLGRGDLEHQPGGHQPADGEADGRLGPAMPARGQGGGQHQGDGEEQQGRQQGVHADEAAVAFVGAGQLGRQIAADGFTPEAAVRGDGDGDGPGTDQQGHQRQAPAPAQLAQPLDVSVPDRQGDDRQGHDQKPDRPLDQDRQANSQPEQQLVPAHRLLIGPRRHIDSRQGRHRQGGQAAQHGVGLGDARFG